MIGHGVPGLDIRQDHEFVATAAAVFAALTITTVPILILYFILQRHVIAGLSATAMGTAARS